MAVDYSEFIEMAQELIAEYGGDAAWEKRVTVPDGSVVWEPGTAPVPVAHPIKAVFLPINSSMLQSAFSSLASLGYIKGTNLPEGLVQVMIPGGQPFEPALQDTILVAGRRLKPVAIDKLAPDGSTAVLYTIQARV